jgi:putative membrane protein insertion efficiency factor
MEREPVLCKAGKRSAAFCARLRYTPIMEGMRLRPDTTGLSPARKVWEWRSVPLLAPIWVYKRYVSAVLPPACRHTPTCSEYCFQAIRQRGIAQGSLIGLWRLLRCAPWGTSGYDPVEAFRWPWEAKLEAPQEEEPEKAPIPSSRIT